MDKSEIYINNIGNLMIDDLDGFIIIDKICKFDLTINGNYIKPIYLFNGDVFNYNFYSN